MIENLELRTLLSAGVLDTSFNSTGTELVQVASNDYEIATAAAVQGDGKTVAAGYEKINSTTSYAVVTRVNADGTPDTTFGTNGQVVLNYLLYFPDVTISSMLVQPDGNIIVGGTSFLGTQGDFFLARIKSNGYLDDSFGGGGVTTTDFGTSTVKTNDQLNAIAMQTDGKIVAVGSTGADVLSSSFAIARYNSNGTLDTTFNSTGKLVDTIANESNIATAVSIAPDAKIVVAGTLIDNPQFSNGYESGLVRRLNPDGTVDLNWGVNGHVVDSFASSGGAGSIKSVIAQADGSVLLAGTAIPFYGGTELAVTAYTSAGILNTGFGNSGAGTALLYSGSVSSGNNLAAMTLEADGKIILVGTFGTGILQVGIDRLTQSGALDQTFNGTGYSALTSASSASLNANAVAVGYDGTIVAVGGNNDYSGLPNTTSNGLQIIRWTGDDGTLAYLALTDSVIGSEGPDTFIVANGPTVSTQSGLVNSAAISINGVTNWLALQPGEVTLGLEANLGINQVDIEGILSGFYVNYSGTSFDKISIVLGAENDSIKVVADTVMSGNNSLFFSQGQVGGISIYGGAGDDLLDASQSYVPVTLDGGDGNDTLMGGSGPDLLLGGAGNDELLAPLNRDPFHLDTLFGGTGNNSGSYQTNDVVSNIQTALNSTVTGMAFSDANSNGIQDSDEVSVGSVNFYLDLNNNGVLDPGEPTSSGFFNDLAAGTYTLRIAAVPAGWTVTTASSVTLKVGAYQTIGGAFGLHQQTPGSSITGFTFYDPNGNGIKDTGETPLAGRTVFLDLNGNGVLDAGEPSQVTSATGAYTFTGLAVKIYQLDQLEPAGFWSTTQGDRVVYTFTNSSSTVSLGSSDKAGIAGNVFYDFNADGIEEPVSPVFGHEYGVSGRTIYLDLNGNGTLDTGEPSTTTDGDGNYSFPNVTPGSYTVRMVPTSNNYGFQSLPAGGGGAAITANAGQVATANFGYALYAQIHGEVFSDTNANGVRDTFESGISGWTVFADYNHNGQLDPGEPSAVTGADGIAGDYVLTQVVPGNVSIGVVSPAGWVGTSSPVVAASNQYTPDPFNLGFVQPSLVAQAGGPYTVTEGGSVTLSAAGSTDVGGTITKYEWSLNYNGSSFTTSGTGQTFNFSAAGLDGPSQTVVGLRVTDSSGLTSLTKAIVNITNAPPTAVFSGSTITLGQAGTVAFSSVSDPSAADTAAGFTYSYDFNDDGIFDLVTTVASATVPSSYLTTTGAHTIAGEITDKDGGSSVYTATVQVTGPAQDPKLTGSVIGTSGSYKNGGNTGAKAFDGNLATYFDGPSASGNWVGLDLGSAKVITSLAYASRSGWASRMNGGTFQASNSSTFASGVVNLYTIASNANPPSTSLTTQTISNATAYRYVRYYGPANSYGDVAEVQFFGHAAVVTNDYISGTITGVPTGTTVYLDANGNSKLDTGEISTTTSSTGAYSFTNVSAGSYVIRQVLPAGYTQTTPPNNAGYSITIANGSSFTNENFTDKAPTTFTRLTGTTIGTAGSYQNDGYTIAKATDGSLSTVFVGPTANGNWVGYDLGSSKSISQLKFAPASGWASRLVGGQIQVSTTANFSSGVTTIYTITTAPVVGSLTTVTLSSPVTARYVRYLSPNGSYGEIAEFEVFG